MTSWEKQVSRLEHLYIGITSVWKINDEIVRHHCIPLSTDTFIQVLSPFSRLSALKSVTAETLLTLMGTSLY